MEYVSKEEVKPRRLFFDEKMIEVRATVKKEGITFTYLLVGSAKRNLVVRHHNKGFDCDYRIILSKNKNEYEAKKIKRIFMDAFDEAFEGTDFDKCEDSTKAITIKEKNKEESKIEFSYDIVILRDINDYYELLKNDKQSNKYFFEQMSENQNFKENLPKVKGAEMWNYLRERYLDKKGANIKLKAPKKSFHLFIESVNETIDKFI